MPTDDAQRFQSMVSGLRSTGQSYRDLSNVCGVSAATLWRLAEGEAKQPSFEVVAKITRAWERAGRPDGHKDLG